MRESKSIALVATVLALCLLMVTGNIQTAKAESVLSVEGEWEIISTNFDSLKNHVGQRQSITRKGNGYEVKWLGSGNVETYTGSETRIVRTVLEDLGSPLSGDTPPEVLRQVKGQKVPINLSYTLSADGNYMQRECDYIHMFYRSQSKRFDHYEIAPGYIKWTLRRVSGPVKVEARGDRAYQADCGPVDPNRTTPITTDLCPGNLVAMTYFCGGGTGCPYVCCPKGLPYLNHCDCKCYATSDFECHSYSRCQEQPKQ